MQIAHPQAALGASKRLAQAGTQRALALSLGALAGREAAVDGDAGRPSGAGASGSRLAHVGGHRDRAGAGPRHVLRAAEDLVITEEHSKVAGGAHSDRLGERGPHGSVVGFLAQDSQALPGVGAVAAIMATLDLASGDVDEDHDGVKHTVRQPPPRGVAAVDSAEPPLDRVPAGQLVGDGPVADLLLSDARHRRRQGAVATMRRARRSGPCAAMARRCPAMASS